jgi:hypothetical protein
MSAWFRTSAGILACPPKGGYTSLKFCMPRSGGGRNEGAAASANTQVTLVVRDPWQRWLSGVYRFKWSKDEHGPAVNHVVGDQRVHEFCTRPLDASYFEDFFHQVTVPLETYGMDITDWHDTDQHYTSTARYLQDCGFGKPDHVIALEDCESYLQQFGIDYKIRNVAADYGGVSKAGYAQLAKDTQFLVRRLWNQDHRWRLQATAQE